MTRFGAVRDLHRAPSLRRADSVMTPGLPWPPRSPILSGEFGAHAQPVEVALVACSFGQHRRHARQRPGPSGAMHRAVLSVVHRIDYALLRRAVHAWPPGARRRLRVDRSRTLWRGRLASSVATTFDWLQLAAMVGSCNLGHKCWP
jgi:hypothetical protein